MRIGLVVLACVAALASVPSIEVRLPQSVIGSPPAGAECAPHLVESNGDIRALDPVTLEARGPAVVVPTRRIEDREVRLGGGTWTHATAIEVFERRGTVTRRLLHEAGSDEWYVGLASSSLPLAPMCEPDHRGDHTVFALLAAGGRPEFASRTNLPVPGPSDPNVFLVALSLDGVEQWRARVPARAGYHYPHVRDAEFDQLLPAAAISTTGRTVAVIHSDLDGSDRLSLVDARTRDVRTMRIREVGGRLRLGAEIADAKMLERRKAWSPRFLDDRYLYAVLHETRTDELGELSVLLIDTTDARVLARWPEHGVLNTVRANLSDWTLADGSVYVAGRDWSPRAYTLYRLDARDLRPLGKRPFDVFPLIRPAPR